jgi:hypothetical protein
MNHTNIVTDQDDTQLVGSYPHGRGVLPPSCLKPEPKPKSHAWRGEAALWLYVAVLLAGWILVWVYTAEIRAWLQKVLS